MLEGNDRWIRMPCLKALGIWGSQENVPALLKFVNDSDLFVRHETFTALGHIGDERAAVPLAQRLVVFEDQHEASQALQKLGSKAEKVVLPYLQNSEWVVRAEVCEILAKIGTKESKTALEAASNDSNGLVAMKAKEALAALAARP